MISSDVSPFVALPDEPGQDAWDDLAKLAGLAAVVATTGVAVVLPTRWPWPANSPAVNGRPDVANGPPGAYSKGAHREKRPRIGRRTASPPITFSRDGTKGLACLAERPCHGVSGPAILKGGQDCR